MIYGIQTRTVQRVYFEDESYVSTTIALMSRLNRYKKIMRAEMERCVYLVRRDKESGHTASSPLYHPKNPSVPLPSQQQNPRSAKLSIYRLSVNAALCVWAVCWSSRVLPGAFDAGRQDECWGRWSEGGRRREGWIRAKDGRCRLQGYWPYWYHSQLHRERTTGFLTNVFWSPFQNHSEGQSCERVLQGSFVASCRSEIKSAFVIRGGAKKEMKTNMSSDTVLLQ